MTRPKSKPKKLVAFQIPDDEAAEMAAEARRYGYTSVSLYARALMQNARTKPETHIAMARIGALQTKITVAFSNRVLALMRATTMEELLGEEEN